MHMAKNVSWRFIVQLWQDVLELTELERQNPNPQQKQQQQQQTEQDEEQEDAPDADEPEPSVLFEKDGMRLFLSTKVGLGGWQPGAVCNL
jgi:hypothetical protein